MLKALKIESSRTKVFIALLISFILITGALIFSLQDIDIPDLLFVGFFSFAILGAIYFFILLAKVLADYTFQLKNFLFHRTLLQIIAFVSIFLLAAWFYWFQLRPTFIRINCQKKASNEVHKTLEKATTKLWKERTDFLYEQCLRFNGLIR
ncbi:MAG: hypothetical protein FJ044_04260 [Candidatus Cloacimonetes bacterium]|nr:hypothetical protein [Candidatus Cloacimonadota bacterium]